MGKLSIQDLHIRYGDQPVIENFSLEIQDGELVSVLGPSGAGKTTILKAVAGLLTPQKGDIFIDGAKINHLPPEKRDAVMVFQKPLLFPFMNVAQNVAFGLRMRGKPGRKERRQIDEILELTQLQGLHRRKVHELSGGQQQRVSLARALVLKPSILLLDEPLSNLDFNLRQQMRELIREHPGPDPDYHTFCDPRSVGSFDVVASSDTLVRWHVAANWNASGTLLSSGRC
jgi:ABC-type Fe3+/spermidine/putrescine transport system ATPase subunit